MAIPRLSRHQDEDEPHDANTERVWATLPRALVQAIDDYHYGARHRNRSAAVRQLVEYGLEYARRKNELVS